jgi:diacylglycerol kinase family enzyme
LGVVSVRVDTAADAEKLAALELAGNVQRFASWNDWTASEFEVRSAGPVEIGIDGEALTLQPPLHFEIRPGALTVRLPRIAAQRSRALRLIARPTLAALGQTLLGRPTGVR